jgi:hypothetical protein
MLGRHPPLEAATSQQVVKTEKTLCVLVCCSYSNLWSVELSETVIVICGYEWKCPITNPNPSIATQSCENIKILIFLHHVIIKLLLSGSQEYVRASSHDRSGCTYYTSNRLENSAAELNNLYYKHNLCKYLDFLNLYITGLVTNSLVMEPKGSTLLLNPTILLNPQLVQT